MNKSLIQDLWAMKNFKPNENQKKAILFDEDKPLFITAAPGSGKTQVLLWRTIHLIVDKHISPDNIFLSTFTEKAAHQLKEGLKELLGIAANITNGKYDLARMYVGTIHSNCRRILLDRAFARTKGRSFSQKMLDELGQYMYIYRASFWEKMLLQAGFENNMETSTLINSSLGPPQQAKSASRHLAVVNTISFFNRLSEELCNPDNVETDKTVLQQLYKMYSYYLSSLKSGPVPVTDLSLLQSDALKLIENSEDNHRFKHVIIDEYQDTNTVQERLVFGLARGSKNLCVVGDDDQALYRFRGATVENFVEFAQRCRQYYGMLPETVSLHTNYRSLKHIVDTSQSFIEKTDWSENGKFYRIQKEVGAHRSDDKPCVFVTDDAHPDEVAPQIAGFIRTAREKGLVNDYNQIAVLFSYLKGNTNVHRLSRALEAEGIPVYAPRAGRFLELDESLVVFGLFAKILGRPALQGRGRDMDNFRGWMDGCMQTAALHIEKDSLLRSFVEDKQSEIELIMSDYHKLIDFCDKTSLNLDNKITSRQLMDMSAINGLSAGAVQKLSSRRLLSMVEQNNPKTTISYIINRVTALDWGILDIFYQLTTFDYFCDIIEKAASGQDEGPICNLGLITQYLSRFQEERGRPILTARDFVDVRIQRHFFASYLFAMYRLGETEFEDKEDPFPRGRVSFITIHQAKGLEFPIVILGGLYRQEKAPGKVETIVRNDLKRTGEPLDRIVEFDNARLFYVALSRAQNILLLPNFSGRGQRRSPSFRDLIEEGIPNIDTLDWNNTDKPGKSEEDMLGKSYSYTSDYLLYKRCPRQYMLFRKYGFVPARSALMLFGTLVHRTIEDLHNYLLEERETA